MSDEKPFGAIKAYKGFNADLTCRAYFAEKQ